MDVPSSAVTERQFRILAALLGGIALLLVLLLAALVVGGISAAHALASLTPGAHPGGPVARAEQTEVELTERQRGFERQVSGVGERTLKDVDGFAARRQALSDASGGPLKKLDTTIRLNQLLSDEMLALLRNLSGMEEAIARGARPLPEQRGLEHPGEARRPPAGRRK